MPSDPDTHLASFAMAATQRPGPATHHAPPDSQLVTPWLLRHEPSITRQHLTPQLPRTDRTLVGQRSQPRRTGRRCPKPTNPPGRPHANTARRPGTTGSGAGEVGAPETRRPTHGTGKLRQGLGVVAMDASRELPHSTALLPDCPERPSYHKANTQLLGPHEVGRQGPEPQ